MLIEYINLKGPVYILQNNAASLKSRQTKRNSITTALAQFYSEVPTQCWQAKSVRIWQEANIAVSYTMTLNMTAKRDASYP